MSDVLGWTNQRAFYQRRVITLTICLFFVYFRPFKQTLQILQQLNVKKVHPVSGAGIWTQDLWIMSLRL